MVRAVENKMSLSYPSWFYRFCPARKTYSLPYDKPLIGRDCFVKIVANWPRSLRHFYGPRRKLGQQCIIKYANLKVCIRIDRKVSNNSLNTCFWKLGYQFRCKIDWLKILCYSRVGRGWRLGQIKVRWLTDRLSPSWKNWKLKKNVNSSGAIGCILGNSQRQNKPTIKTTKGRQMHYWLQNA